MGARGLDKIFNPHRIALLGVTINPNSVGGKVLGNLVGGGFTGVVYPVNPDSEAVMGVPCYPDVASLPKTPDLAVICSPAKDVPEQVAGCGQAGIRGVIIISAGFKETGEAGAALEQQIRTEAARFDDMRIIGPNCLGIIVPSRRLNVSFASSMPRPGHVAFISQSGALCTSVLDWAIEGKIGFSYLVSIGNSLDVGFGDLIDYFGEDNNTKSIVMYVESLTRARRFMTAARAFARSKPILAFKAGRFPESAAAASSHTGAMVSEDAVYDAAFQRVGVTRIFDTGDIFDCTELIGRSKMPGGSQLAIITNAGGPGVIAADTLIDCHGRLARLSSETMAELNKNLPPSWSHGNPVDVLGDANSKRIARAAEIVLGDPAVDAVLVILTPQAMTNPTAAAKAIGKLAETTPKPILAAWLGGATMRESIGILVDNGVATFRTPEQAVRAFMTLVSYARNLETLYETPKDIPVQFDWDREQLHKENIAGAFARGDILTETESKALLAAYGINVTRPIPAASASEAAAVAAKMGYPVVLKINSKEITHKTDIGGVVLNLKNEAEVVAAYEKIIANAAAACPTGRIDGVTVQPMVNNTGGIEMILGIKSDAVFGTVMMAGMGGTVAELMGERCLGFPPLNERLARRMLESLRIWPLFKGYRGRPAVQINKLLEVLIRLSYLAADYPEIKELDINPLLVNPDEVIALDARIVVNRDAIGKVIEPYSHLALRPYPEKYVKVVELKDGTQITFRPIKPEDEPLWMDMLASCSKETIYSRFRYFFQWASHDVATRYCYIDYDREIAIVAEISDSGGKKLIGVVRLIADPDHESVEYAILITDAWQGKEIGSMLTDYSLEIAKKWRLKRVVAQTTTDNYPMVSVFQKKGFTITRNDADTTVDVVKEMD